MCITDDCDEGRRTFLTTGAAAVIGLTASKIAGQTQYPHNHKVVTRVLDDPSITHGPVVFKQGGKDTIDGFLARPKTDGRYPAVVVIPGNVITEEYIPNTCAALALAGYVGLAPNIFHTLPAAAQTPEERRLATVAHTDSDCLLDIQSGIDYLRGQPFVQNGGMGAVGFCFGGHLAMMLGSRSREIDAVVPYHPGPTSIVDVARLTSPGFDPSGHRRPQCARSSNKRAGEKPERPENSGRSLLVRRCGSRISRLYAALLSAG